MAGQTTGAPPVGTEADVRETLLGVWRDVLGVDDAGPHDNFFSLGGDSIRAFEIANEAQELGLPLEPDEVFVAQTVAALSRHVFDARRRDQAHGPRTNSRSSHPGGTRARGATLVAKRDGGLPESALAPVTFQQEGVLRYLSRAKAGVSYNCWLAWEVDGAVDEDVFALAVGDVVAHQAVLGTRIVRSGGSWAQELLADPQVCTIRRVAGWTRDRITRAMADDAEAPFEVGRDTLFRAVLYRGDESERSYVVLSAHHLIADGWSMGLLTQGLDDAFAARSRGRQWAPARLPHTYAEYSEAQRASSSPVPEASFRHWRELLAGYEAPVRWPDTEAAADTAEAKPLTFTLPERALAHLTAVASGRRISLFPVLLATTNAALARATGGRDFVVASPVANRPDRDTHGIVGFFANAWLTRAVIDESTDLGALAEELARQWRDAGAHGDAYLEQLLDRLSLPHIANVWVAMQNAPDQDGASLAFGARAEPIDLPVQPKMRRDLLVQWFPQDEGLTCCLSYRPAAVPHAVAERIAHEIAAIASRASASTRVW